MSRKKSRPKSLRVLVLMHEDLVPPDDVTGLPEKEVERFKSEYDVIVSLQHLGHEIRKLGLHDELKPLRDAVEEFKPHIVFNLLEEFRGLAVYDQNVVAYLELLGVPYTGNSPRAMVLTRDKALTKKILHYHRIKTPGFAVFPLRRKVRRPKALGFPLIVKSLVEEASTAISQASVVSSDEKLVERVQFIHETVGTPAIAEEYIEGREVYAPLLGNRRVQVLPIWELRFNQMPPASHRIATHKVKWDLDYQERYGITIGRAKDLGPELEQHIVHTSRRIHRVLGMSGYGRLDYRLSADGGLYLLEANPNPDISSDEELASAAEAAGLTYDDLIQKVLNLGLRREPGT